MADLPEDCSDPLPPLTDYAVDYFGPFTIKEGRKEIKRYRVLFTCLASTAVHLETSTTLATGALINFTFSFYMPEWPNASAAKRSRRHLRGS